MRSAVALFLVTLAIPIPGQRSGIVYLVPCVRSRTPTSARTAVLAFVKHVMDPVRYVGQTVEFEMRRSDLNVVLAFCGVVLGEDGGLHRAKTARTVSEAEASASLLRKALVERRVHEDVLKFCRAELVADNYFHAVFEATKSVAEKLRERACLASDGGKLVDEALGLGTSGVPRLAFNTLRTESERSEHTGLMNLIKGVFGAFRNTTAHRPKIYWRMTEQGRARRFDDDFAGSQASG